MGKLKGKPIRTFSYQELVGLDDTSMIPWQGDAKILIHKDLEVSLNKLIQAAKDAGFDLALASGYRSYERQLTIWNEKCQGIRPIYDRQGRVFKLQKTATRKYRGGNHALVCDTRNQQTPLGQRHRCL